MMTTREYEGTAVARLPPLRSELGREDLMLLRRCEALRLGDVLVWGTLEITFSQNVSLRRAYWIRRSGRLICTIVSSAEKHNFQERVLAARLAGWCKQRRFSLIGAVVHEGDAAEAVLTIRHSVMPQPICRYEYERPI